MFLVRVPALFVKRLPFRCEVRISYYLFDVSMAIIPYVKLNTLCSKFVHLTEATYVLLFL